MYNDFLKFQHESDMNKIYIEKHLSAQKALDLLQKYYPNAIQETKPDQIILLEYPSTFALVRGLKNEEKADDKPQLMHVPFTDVYDQLKSQFKKLSMVKMNPNYSAILITTSVQLELLGQAQNSRLTHTCTVIDISRIIN
jgi:hypothetical protein